MGLDNGVILKTKDKNIKLPKWLESTKQSCYSVNGKPNGYYSYDIFYWRKCWGLRNTAIRFFECKANSKVRITTKNIHYLNRLIKYYYFSIPGIRSWYTNEMNNWGYFPHRLEEGFVYLYRLWWLNKFLHENKLSVYVYFYDSF